MKNQLLTLIFALISFSSFGQICTPDLSYQDPGIFPPGATKWDSIAVMPGGVEGMYYDQVVQMVAPPDTVIDTFGQSIPVIIDSIYILGFPNLPSSLSYACNTPNCFIEGGENGCIRFTGTPTSADIGLHVFKMKTLGYARLQGFGQLTDTINFFMSINIQAPQSVAEDMLTNSISINPNPIKTTAKFSFEVSDEENYTFEIIDLTGKKIYSTSGTTKPGVNKIDIDRKDYSEGLYFYALRWNGISQTGRLMFVD